MTAIRRSPGGWRQSFRLRTVSTRRRASKRLDEVGGKDVGIFGLNYPPEHTGIAPYAGTLATGLAAAGYNVTAHVAHPHYPEWRRYEGYGAWLDARHVDGVLVKRRLHYVPQPPRGIRRLLSELSFGVRIAAANWKRPDLVIAISPPLFATALAVLRLRLMLRRPRLVVWVQDIYSLGIAETQEGGAVVERITRWIERWSLRAADRIVVIHPRFREFLVDKLGVPPSKIVVVRNWTHLPPSQSVDRTAARARLRWPADATLAVHTGNMGVKQGLENVVDAARVADEREVPVHFILVGDGGERRNLEEYGRGIERLSFVDPLSEEDYRLALGASDVLIINEKSGVSGMALPSKLTTYFDAGRPVVAATDPGGITASEVMEAGAGLVVPAGEPEALLDALLSLRSDPDLAARFAEQGRRHREAVLGEQTAMKQWCSLVSATIRNS